MNIATLAGDWTQHYVTELPDDSKLELLSSIPVQVCYSPLKDKFVAVCEDTDLIMGEGDDFAGAIAAVSKEIDFLAETTFPNSRCEYSHQVLGCIQRYTKWKKYH